MAQHRVNHVKDFSLESLDVVEFFYCINSKLEIKKGGKQRAK